MLPFDIVHILVCLVIQYYILAYCLDYGGKYNLVLPHNSKQPTPDF